MIFSVQNGSFAYKNGKTLFKDINFTVKPGQLMAILGSNGIGKTTLLRCMMGFLPWKSGVTLIDGKNLKSYRFSDIWKKIAYVPQARGVVSANTVEEMVLLGRGSCFGMLSQPRMEDIEEAHNALKRLKIEHLANKRCNEISGGELQMVLIARALAGNPKILVLDEPESNLDFKNQLIVLDTMSSLVADGYSCIFNTHYPTHALQRADHSLLIGRDGYSIYDETHNIITEENISLAFGVRAIIGKIETPQKYYHDVLPLEVMTTVPDKKFKNINTNKEENENMETRIAIVSIIIEDRKIAEKVNDILHQYSQYIVSRMGMPYPKKNISIICIVVDAPENIISAISGKIGMLQDVSIKATYSKH